MENKLISAHYCAEDGEIDVGDVIYSTTSELEFNAITGDFERTDSCVELIVREISRDFNDFDSRFCRTGGKYGYYTFEVIKVLN